MEVKLTGQALKLWREGQRIKREAARKDFRVRNPNYKSQGKKK